MDYNKANEYLGKKLNRPIGTGRATRLVRNSGVTGDSIHLKLHDTYIVTWYADGRIKLNSGGWRTVTTKARINEYLNSGYYVNQERGQWYLGHYSGNGKHERLGMFEDGLTIHADGKIEGMLPMSDADAANKLRRKVQKYAAKYMDAFAAGNVPAPSAGDCWFCSMRTENKQTLGESFKDDSHILSHIEEDYFVPSLLARAFEVMPHSQAMGWALGKAWGPEDQRNIPVPDFIYPQLQKSLSRYILRQLGQAS